MDNKIMGTVYWITGLSGAGKTTIAKELYKYLKTKKNNVVMLDGDILRNVYGNDLGYIEEDRKKGAMRNARLCEMLSKQGIDVICATISMFDSCRDWNRKNINNYCEIYLRVPIEVLKERNQKGLYSDNAANVLGINMKFEEPKKPDIVINNDGEKTIAEVSSLLIQKLSL